MVPRPSQRGQEMGMTIDRCAFVHNPSHFTKMILSTHTSYLSFFLHEQNFWRIKFTLKKRVNYDKIHSKWPIFCVKSEKNYTGQKFFTRIYLWGS